MHPPTVPPCAVHHSPPGANASLTLGAFGRGFSLDHERNQPGAEDGDWLVAWGHGPGTVRYLPFAAGVHGLDQETAQMQSAAAGAPDTVAARWRPVPATQISRTLTPSCDAFACGPLTFRLWSPYPRIPRPISADDLRPWCLPAIWLEVELDNTGCDRDATVFLGLRWRAAGRMRPLAWEDPSLEGVALGERWALAATSADGAFTIRDGSVAAAVEDGRPITRMAGLEGGIALRVPAGQRRILRACLAWQHHGPATQGVVTTYALQRFWPDLPAVCRTALAEAGQRLVAAAKDDAELLARCAGRPWLAAFLAQAARGYAANSQLLLDRDDGVHWCVLEGQYWWRNTLDLAADHLAWELDRHPWVVGRIMADHRARHAYRDRIRLPGEAGFAHAGGLSFAHDQGNSGQYAPPGTSGYERSGVRGCYSFMTLEQLLNGIYALAAAEAAGDLQGPELWRELLESLLRRDHPDAARRTGILTAESDRVGADGAEITTYDALDHSLMAASGSVYIGLKGLCAALLIARAAQRAGDTVTAATARAWAAQAEAAWASRMVNGRYPANALDPAVDSRVLAALDPFAMPLHLGLGCELAAMPGLREHLSLHARTCLAEGCRHSSGGLRLSSTADMTWPSKVVLCLHVLAWLGWDLERDEPAALRELLRWSQSLAAHDQVRLDRDAVIGGAYYPRMVTAAILLAPADTTIIPPRPGSIP